MIQHWPVLQVVLPLLAAPLCVLWRSHQGAWLIYTLAAAVSTLISVQLLISVLANGPLHYALGGWEPPFGIEYVIDAASSALLLLVSFVALTTAAYSRQAVQREIEQERIYLFYACMCLLLAGLLGIVATADAFNVFVFLEISSLSSYALIAMGRRRQALLAAFQYLVIGTVGGTFLLISLGFAYALTGTLNMGDMAVRLAALPTNAALTATVAFALIGLAIKAAVFPLHAWQPAAYSEAPSAVASFVSGTGTKVALYAICRFAFTVFGVSLVFEQLPTQTIGLVFGCAGMLAGALVACRSKDLRRILAWSSVSQIGYIVVGISLATATGLSAAFIHMVGHGVIKAGLFAVTGLIVLRLGGASLYHLAGLGQRSPWLFAALLFGGLGLIGVPGTAGFISKWTLVLGLIESQQYLVLACVLSSSLLAVIYVWRIVEAAWFQPPTELQTSSVPSFGAGLCITALAAASAAIGLGLGGAADISMAAANALLGGGR